MCITQSFRCFRLALLAVLLAFLQVAAAAATTYEISGTYAHVRFTITKWLVFQEEGGFRDLAGTLLFDPQRPDNAHIDVVVQAASIDTNNSTRDRVLRSDDFFDVEKFPTSGFTALGLLQSPATSSRSPATSLSAASPTKSPSPCISWEPTTCRASATSPDSKPLLFWPARTTA
jgi:hypothetical protein